MRMHFKSEAQRRKFHILYAQKKISREQLSHWEDETGNKKLPERKRKRI